jgi:hypothetical protein
MLLLVSISLLAMTGAFTFGETAIGSTRARLQRVRFLYNLPIFYAQYLFIRNIFLLRNVVKNDCNIRHALQTRASFGRQFWTVFSF